jgi:hypothetical protein
MVGTMNRTLEVSLLAVLLVLVWPGEERASAQTPERIVQITNAAALPLEKAVMEVRLSEVESFAGGDFRFDYDPTILLIEDVQLALATHSFLMVHDVPETGVLAVSLASAEGLEVLGEMAILSIEVAVLPSVPLETMTSFAFHSARWYDEESNRYGLVADNALLYVGNSIPSEEVLEILLGETSGSPGAVVEIPLSVSMGVGIAEVSGEVRFDSTSLHFNGFIPSASLLDWQDRVEFGTGVFDFQLSGDRELAGINPSDMAWLQFRISTDAPIGSIIPIVFLNGEARSLDGCPFLVELVGGRVGILEPQASVENCFLLE